MRVWSVAAATAERTAAEVAESLREGAVIAVPTDTYYGLAADIRRSDALARVRRLKGRPAGKPLLLLVDTVARARGLSPHAPELLERLAERFWPGPLTMVLPATEDLPDEVIGNRGGVAVRAPATAIVRAIVAALGAPVTGTSANVSGQPPAEDVSTIRLGETVDGVVDGGRTPGGAPSTLLDLTTRGEARILRPGPVTQGDLRAILGAALL